MDGHFLSCLLRSRSDTRRCFSPTLFTVPTAKEDDSRIKMPIPPRIIFLFFTLNPISMQFKTSKNRLEIWTEDDVINNTRHRAGMDLIEIQALLGHASLDMTLRYIEMFEDDFINAH